MPSQTVVKPIMVKMRKNSYEGQGGFHPPKGPEVIFTSVINYGAIQHWGKVALVSLSTIRPETEKTEQKLRKGRRKEKERKKLKAAFESWVNSVHMTIGDVNLM